MNDLGLDAEGDQHETSDKSTSTFVWRRGLLRSLLLAPGVFFASVILSPFISIATTLDTVSTAGVTIVVTLIFFVWGIHAFSAPREWRLLKFFVAPYLAVIVGGAFLLFVQELDFSGESGVRLAADLFGALFGIPLLFGLLGGGLFSYTKRNRILCEKHFPGSKIVLWSSVAYYSCSTLLFLTLVSLTLVPYL